MQSLICDFVEAHADKKHKSTTPAYKALLVEAIEYVLNLSGITAVQLINKKVLVLNPRTITDGQDPAQILKQHWACVSASLIPDSYFNLSIQAWDRKLRLELVKQPPTHRLLSFFTRKAQQCSAIVQNQDEIIDTLWITGRKTVKGALSLSMLSLFLYLFCRKLLEEIITDPYVVFKGMGLYLFYGLMKKFQDVIEPHTLTPMSILAPAPQKRSPVPLNNIKLLPLRSFCWKHQGLLGQDAGSLWHVPAVHYQTHSRPRKRHLEENSHSSDVSVACKINKLAATK